MKNINPLLVKKNLMKFPFLKAFLVFCFAAVVFSVQAPVGFSAADNPGGLNDSPGVEEAGQTAKDAQDKEVPKVKDSPAEDPARKFQTLFSTKKNKFPSAGASEKFGTLAGAETADMEQHDRATRNGRAG